MKIHPYGLLTAALLTATPALAWPTPPRASDNVDTHQTQHQTAIAGARSTAGAKSTSAASAQGTASAITGASTSSVTLSGVGGSSTPPGRAPDVVLPSIGAAGMDCPTVGFGAGGAGLGGGGGIGPSWLSSDCNHRKITEIVLQLWGAEAARAYAIANLPGVKDAIPAEPARPAYKFPPWCRASNGVWLSDLAECRP